MWAEKPEIQEKLKAELDKFFKGDNRLTPQEMKVLQNNYDVRKWQIIQESREKRGKIIQEIHRRDIISAIKNFPEYKEGEKFFNKLPDNERKALQRKIGVNPGWNYWPKIFFALYNYSQEKWKLVKSEPRKREIPIKIPKTLEGIRDINSSSLQSLNGKLSWERKDFIAQFWWFTTELSRQLSIGKDGKPQKYTMPQWYINAIIHQETTFWLDLDHSWGSRWLMQLTKRPFADMHGDSGWKIWVAKEQSWKYIPIFQQLDIQAIKNIDMWNGNKVENSLPSDVWKELEEISDKNNPISINRFQDIIAHFHILLKKPKDKNNYYHILNMIVGSVYLKSLIEKNHWNLKISAIQYNGNIKLKHNYARKVMKYHKQEQGILKKES